MLKQYLCMLLFLFFTGLMVAQTVSGIVVDEKGIPIVGATAMLKNTNIGTATNVEGVFELTVPENGATLVVTAIGYRTFTQEVTGTEEAPISVMLEEDAAKLDEVVVTGLATTVKRSNLANAVATISAKELVGVTLPQTVDGALNGKIPGAIINSNSGAPGGGISVKLRGVTSINAASQPLYIIDGVFMDNSSISTGLNSVTDASRNAGPTSNQDNASNRIADLNPADIENIEVLKGASAAAIYGSQAAAGVIIITTKRGKAGKTRIGFSQDLGVTTVRRLLGQRDVSNLDSATIAASWGRSAYADWKAAKATGKFYDYEKEMYGEAGLLTNTRLTISGGTEKTRFYLGGTLKNEKGIVANTGYGMRSLRANIDHRISDKVSLAWSNSFIRSSSDRGLFNNDNTGITNSIALSSTPGFMELHPDAQGNYPTNKYAAANPLETIEKFKNNEINNRFVTGLNLTAFLHQNNKTSTKLVARGGMDYYTLKSLVYAPPSLQWQSNGNGTNGLVSRGNTTSSSLNLAAFLVNTFAATDNINLTTTAGTTFEKYSQDRTLVTATQLIGTQTNVDQAGAVSAIQDRLMWTNNGVFVQEEINLMDYIQATVGVRADKSTNNGNVNKLYTYPKASLSVNISKMPFWTVSQVDNLKFRTAYGQSGNFPTFGSKFTPLIPGNINGSAGSVIGTSRGNSGINPERQTELEIGLDASILKGRASLEFTYYIKSIKDLLLLRATPPSSGFASQFVNAGSLNNRGVEISLNTVPVKIDNFKWNLRINWWKNKSKVTELAVPSFTTGAFATSLGIFKIEEGKSATQIIGLDNGNVAVLGNAEPDFQMGFLNEFNIINNISLSCFIHWKKGGDNINLTQFLTDLGGTSADYDKDTNGNGTSDAIDRINDFGVSSKNYVMDASYLRIREIGLYYTFPSSVTQGWASNLKIGISANNYFTFTKYIGYDPEVSNFGSGGISTGVDVNPFPTSKRLFFHLAAEF